MSEQIFPSVMAKDQAELDRMLERYQGMVPELHLDLADNTFTPSTAMDFDLKLSEHFRYNFHLMTTSPKIYIEKYKDVVQTFIPQAEAGDITDMISYLKSMGKPVAFALKPETPVDFIKAHINDIEIILILTVNPGFYGSPFLEQPLEKVAQIKALNPHIKIIVDGGMKPITLPKAKASGADFFVCGSFLAKADSPQKALEELHDVLNT